MEKLVKIYSVRDAKGSKGKEVFRGSANEIANFLNCTTSHIYLTADFEKLVNDKYYIYYSGLEKRGINTSAGRPKIQLKPRQVKKTKKQEQYQRILKHLDIYGNTGLSKDPIKLYGKDFEQDGYIIDVEYRPKRIGAGKDDVWDEIWIITLKEKIEVNKQ